LLNSYCIKKKYKKLKKAHSYSIVQIPNYKLIGLFINDPKVIYRLSTSRIKYDIYDNKYSILSKFVEILDVYCIRKSAFAYCPSKILSCFPQFFATPK